MSLILPAKRSECSVSSQAWPTVAFDSHLGSVVSHIDFDHGVCADRMLKSGLTTIQASDTRIVFKRKRASSWLAGSYYPEEKEITVGVASNTSAIDVNQTLTHELKHRIDDAKGRFNGKPGTINKVQNNLLSCGLLANAAGLALSWGDAHIFGGQHGSEIRTASIALHALGTTMLLGYGMMYFGFNPIERDARAAERNPVKAVHLTLRRPGNKNHRP